MIRVLIADDHQMFIDGLKSLLERESGIEITGSANNGTQALECIEAQKPDVVLLDINMPEMNGINTTALIRKKYPAVKVLILTMYKTKGFINGLTRTGAAGYILKNTSHSELMEAIRTVAAGGTFFSKEVAETLSDKKPRFEVHSDASLSKREIEIIREIAKGLTTKQIAEKLFISYYTIETHRKNILSKLQLTNTAEVILYASQSGLLD